MKAPVALAARSLTVIAAAFFIGAFALATLLSPTMTLAELIASMDHGWLVRAQEFVHAHLSDWVWFRVALPVLIRPSWLLPAAFGIIAAGAAMTASSRQGPQRSRRRRS